MSLQSVITTVKDGGIGVVRPSASYVAVVGPSSGGTLNTPTAITRVDGLGSGPGVEAAALVLRGGTPVLYVRADSDPVPIAGVKTTRVSGSTSVASVDATVDPLDDAQIVVEIVTGGTVGTDGIAYRYSLDAGRSWSKKLKLGTATTLTVSGYIKLNFASGDLDAGDKFEATCVAPTCSASQLQDAFAALKQSSLQFRRLVVASVVGTAEAGAVDTFAIAQQDANQPFRWIGNLRMLDNSDLSDIETGEEYQTFADGVIDVYSSVYANLYAREAYVTSAVTGREERRPAMFGILARQCSVEEHIDISAPIYGALPGVRIRGLDGNPDPLVYDGELDGGALDDLGLATLRSWSGVSGGAFCTNPRCPVGVGSDYQYIHRGLVMDLAHVTAYQDLVMILSVPTLTNTDGTIAETAAVGIEDRLLGKLNNTLVRVGKTSSVDCAITRTNNLAATELVLADVGCFPLGYPKRVGLTIGYKLTA